MLRDWISPRLLDCNWYFDYPKENIPPSKFELWEKYEPIFLQGLGALEKETPTKKIMEGCVRKGKRHILKSASEMKDKKDVPTQSQIKVEFGLGISFLQEVPLTST